MKTGLALATLGVALFALPAHAAVITVAPGEVEVAANGQCSLIEAIRNAESGSDQSVGDCVAGTIGADVIELATDSTYVLTSAVDDFRGLPRIRSQLTINGNGAIIERDAALFNVGGQPCSGSGARFSPLWVAGDGNLVLRDLGVRNGCDQFKGGGAILNHGTLLLERVLIENSQSTLSGGGIHNNGSLTIRESTLRDLHSNAAGGGLVNRGTLVLERSLIEGNYSVGAGGGMETGVGSATAFNVTLSGNQSRGAGGGGAVMGGSFASTNVTIADNASNVAEPTALAGPGGGLWRSFGTVTLNNTLFAMQANGFENCGGSMTHNNTVADDDTCGGSAATPLLAALANNGGPTRTHALLPGSAAIDTGNDALAVSLTTDQRGIGFSRVIGTQVDVGAYEYANDGDGVDASEENNVPDPDGTGFGDGNADSVQDSQQAHVTSFNTSVGAAMATLETSDASKPLVNVSAEPAPVNGPAGVQFPYGMFSFTISNVTPGATEEVVLFVPFNAEINGYWKQNTSGNWANIATSISQVGNKTRIVFPLTEGGPFDFDADSTTITDPGGPGIQLLSDNIASIPSLSQWMVILLSISLALTAVVGRRRRCE
ncbi:IPTL-CTERM sorting domain-containing protein [Halopseudomonas salegens]|uniref:IPTL-CTERM protein sorting domain-containing protein n=1 Tax=Halopseudomonas salegens TaxID=1434072 RepID=A0A1H2FWK0_9GAMM|nr:IPTL-CTERM sorting domain-containing protein [Halopseudomonas salegens]SDU11640.1 IPTL-CTERM protein sorting domain-containing protein [Halopseudomonas salegens]